MSTVDPVTVDTAAMLRRMVRRALTVLGGTVAGIAAAWAISSASASAELPGDVAPLPVSGMEQLAGAGELVGQLSEVVRAVEQVVPAPPIADLSAGAQRAADDFGRDLGLAPQIPVDIGELGRSDRPGADPAPGGGAHVPLSLVRPVGDPSAAAPSVAITHRFDPDVRAPRTATERALGDGMTRRGSPEPAPLAPWTPAPLPVAPATMPASGSSGNSGAGADSPAFAALPRSAAPLGLTGSRALPATELPSATGPGAQPGVTPD